MTEHMILPSRRETLSHTTSAIISRSALAIPSLSHLCSERPFSVNLNAYTDVLNAKAMTTTTPSTCAISHRRRSRVTDAAIPW